MVSYSYSLVLTDMIPSYTELFTNSQNQNIYEICLEVLFFGLSPPLKSKTSPHNSEYNKDPPPHSLGCRTPQSCYSALDLSPYYSTRSMSIIWHIDHPQSNAITMRQLHPPKNRKMEINEMRNFPWKSQKYQKIGRRFVEISVDPKQSVEI